MKIRVVWVETNMCQADVYVDDEDWAEGQSESGGLSDELTELLLDDASEGDSDILDTVIGSIIRYEVQE